MARIILFLGVITLFCNKIALGQKSSSDGPSVEDAFRQYNLVPQFLPTAPTSTLDVFYINVDPDGNIGTPIDGPPLITVNLGNELPEYITKNMPGVDWDADDNATYTLIMFDPDSQLTDTTSTTKSEVLLQWLVVNIPNNDLDNGETLISYNPPYPAGPTPGLTHRYTFVLYKQSGKVTRHSKQKLGRQRFSIQDFTSQYNLTGPVNGNFFTEHIEAYSSKF